MSKIIHRKLAKVFPATHPRKGEPTGFKDKIWAPDGVFIKKHTIRGGNHFQVGDFIQFSEWEGKPYNSKSIKLHEPLEIVKVWEFKITNYGFIIINGAEITYSEFIRLAKNDGFENTADFYNWFFPKGKIKPFTGQIICWDKDIEY